MLMMGCALLAALGSVWLERLGGHVLRARKTAGQEESR